MRKTSAWSCHCKAVTFEADIDLAKGAGKCNCTFCWKQRMWTGQLKPEDFRLLPGEEVLGDYGKAGDWGEGHYRFCTKCGIATHGHSRKDPIGGEYVSVQPAALDDLPGEEHGRTP